MTNGESTVDFVKGDPTAKILVEEMQIVDLLIPPLVS